MTAASVAFPVAIAATAGTFGEFGGTVERARPRKMLSGTSWGAAVGTRGVAKGALEVPQPWVAGGGLGQRV